MGWASFTAAVALVVLGAVTMFLSQYEDDGFYSLFSVATIVACLAAVWKGM